MTGTVFFEYVADLLQIRGNFVLDLRNSFPACTNHRDRIKEFVRRAPTMLVDPVHNLDLYVGTCCYAQILHINNNAKRQQGLFYRTIYAIRDGTWKPPAVKKKKKIPYS